MRIEMIAFFVGKMSADNRKYGIFSSFVYGKQKS